MSIEKSLPYDWIIFKTVCQVCVESEELSRRNSARGLWSNHSRAVEFRALALSIFPAPVLFSQWQTTGFLLGHLKSNMAKILTETNTRRGKRPRRHDVISCQRETTWRTLCIVFVGNRTMSRNLWSSVTHAKNGTMEGGYDYFSSCDHISFEIIAYLL